MKRIARILLTIMLCFVVTVLSTVAYNPEVVEAKVKINKKVLSLEVGQSRNLKITGTSKKVKWSSSDKSVATVSKKGSVKAIAPGSATITAKVGKKKYTCEVTCTALPAAEFQNSGCDNVPKLNKNQIYTLFTEQAPTRIDEDFYGIFDAVPSAYAPYDAGKVKEEYLQQTTDRLSALRYLGGLPGVKHDAVLDMDAQYGAVLAAANGKISHYPDQPSDMSDDFYKRGYAAANVSNLSSFTLDGFWRHYLAKDPDHLMHDAKGEDNLTTVGHRRWQLNPTLGKIGIGYAVKIAEGIYPYEYYTFINAHDTSGSCGDYHFIAWPSSGYFPNDLLDNDINANDPWSVTLNPKYYSAPSASSVKVMLTRESDGKVWEFSNGNYSVSDKGEWFHVNNNTRGVNNCIIFRPADMAAKDYSGTYTVRISGIQDRNGKSTELNYQVEFFSFDDPGLTHESVPAIQD